MFNRTRVNNPMYLPQQQQQPPPPLSPIPSNQVMYDGVSNSRAMYDSGAPGSRLTYDELKPKYDGVNLTTRPFLRTDRVVDTTPINVDEMKDAVSAWIDRQLQFISNTIVKYILGVVGVIVYIAIFAISMSAVNPKMVPLPNMIVNSSVWAFLQHIPLVIWFTLGLCIPSLVGLFRTDTNQRIVTYIQSIMSGFVGLQMIYYAILNRKNCKRYLIAIAGLYIAIISALQMRLLGITTVQPSSIMYNLIDWKIVICIVLVVVDHYVFLPKCFNISVPN